MTDKPPPKRPPKPLPEQQRRLKNLNLDDPANIAVDLVSSIGRRQIFFYAPFCSPLTQPAVAIGVEPRNGRPQGAAHHQSNHHARSAVRPHESILKSWIAVGFLLMMRNAINDPKVCHELNGGDTTDDMNQRIELIFHDYRKAATNLKRAGFNDEALDIEPSVVEERDEITEAKEKLIQLIIKNKAINSSGKLFKLGIHIANCKVVLEASRRLKIMKEEEDQQKALKKRVKEGTKEKKAVIAFEAWKASGLKKNVDGKPVFAKVDDPKNVVKFLIPIIASEETNVWQYTSSAKKSVERLMQVAGGTT